MPSFHDYFERVCIINMAKHTERRERLSGELTSLGLAEASRITWVNGIDGTQIPPPTWWQRGPGAWGCLLSHAKIVEQAITDKIETVLILEDDATFHRLAPAMLRQFMSEVPQDWDQIYLGGQHLAYPAPVTDRPWVLRPQNINRTHAYALHQRVLPEFYQHIWAPPGHNEGSSGWHIDHQLGSAHERQLWNLYTPLWWLCGQEAGLSSTNWGHHPRYWWHPAEHSYSLPFIPLATATPHPSLYVNTEDTPPTTFSSMEDKLALYKWLRFTAARALNLQLLPTFPSDIIPAALVKDFWPSGILEETDPAKLHALSDYPWHGAFKMKGLPLNVS